MKPSSSHSSSSSGHAAGSMRPAWQYFKASVPAVSFMVELETIGDFIRAAELNASKVILQLREGPGTQPSHFAIAWGGGLLRQATGGFATLEDYGAATRAGFDDAADYYAAMAAGYKDYNDYRMALEAGISEAGTVADMKTGGFVAGFAEWSRLRAAGEPLATIGEPTNAYELYQSAKARHYDTWADMLAGLRAGFGDGSDYKAAKAAGFETAAMYDDALGRGFTTKKDYDFALEHKIRNAQDGAAFFAIEMLGEGPLKPHDEKVLLKLLSRLEQGKRASANKLWEHLGKMIDEYRFADTGDLPAWFRLALPSREDMARYLSSNDAVKSYGSYDSEGEFFESKPLRDREVVIDGSNVAYNSANRKDAKPQAANMLLMTRYLKSKGFERVSIIADAALRHKLADADVLPELEAEAEYIVAPAEKAADVFIIQHVRNHHCLLVSNDTFREWKIQEPWVAENIDYYRLTFLIRGEEVIMPDLV